MHRHNAFSPQTTVHLTGFRWPLIRYLTTTLLPHLIMRRAKIMFLKVNHPRQMLWWWPERMEGMLKGSVDGSTLEEVDNFKYLSVRIQRNGNISKEIGVDWQWVWMHWMVYDIKKSKLRVIWACIFPIATYACEGPLKDRREKNHSLWKQMLPQDFESPLGVKAHKLWQEEGAWSNQSLAATICK